MAAKSASAWSCGLGLGNGLIAKTGVQRWIINPPIFIICFLQLPTQCGLYQNLNKQIMNS